VADVYLSCGAFRTRELGAIVEECRRERLTHLELSSGVAWAPDLLAPVRAERGLTYLVHNYFPTPREPFVLNLAAADPAGLAASLDLGRRAIDLARELGAPFYSVHAGFALNLGPEDLGKPDVQAKIGAERLIPRERALATFAESVRTLADYGSARGVRLLLENNVVAPKLYRARGVNPLLLCDGDEVAAFFKALGHPNVGLLVDVGHAKVSGTALGFAPRAFVERVAPLIEAFHLSDNDGIEDRNEAFGRDAWFAPLLADFDRATFVIEAYRLEPRVMREQIDLARQLVG
jgi:sugar phosphate isomerase/epimerase